MEFVKFVFSSFWTFVGVFLLSLVAVSIIKTFFDFIVELVHGKQIIINTSENTDKEKNEKEISNKNK